MGIEVFCLGGGDLKPCGQPLWSFCATTGDFWIIPFFFKFEVMSYMLKPFMCHHILWPTSVSHPFSSLNSSLSLDGGKHQQEITIPILRHFLQKCCLSRLLSLYSLLSLFFRLSSGWFLLQSVSLFQSREVVMYLESLQTDVELLSPMASKLGCPQFLSSFFIHLFLI